MDISHQNSLLIQLFFDNYNSLKGLYKNFVSLMSGFCNIIPALHRIFINLTSGMSKPAQAYCNGESFACRPHLEDVYNIPMIKRRNIRTLIEVWGRLVPIKVESGLSSLLYILSVPSTLIIPLSLFGLIRFPRTYTSTNSSKIWWLTPALIVKELKQILNTLFL